MEKKKQSSLKYNIKYRVGNFHVIKTIRRMSSKDRAELVRSIDGVDEETRNAIAGQIKKGVPFITVSTITDTWRMSFCITLAMFSQIDAMEYEGDAFTEESQKILRILLSNIFLDSTLLGDAAYYADKMKTLDSFLARQKKDVNKKDDDKDLDDVKANMEAEKDILGLVSQMKDKE